MNKILRILNVIIIIYVLFTLNIHAQVTSERSSRSAANYDSEFIASNIEDLQDILFFSRQAMDRASDSRTKEIAGQMVPDYTTVIYSMEQLASAGGGGGNKEKFQGSFKETAALNGKLAGSKGLNFDTLWVSNLLVMQQLKYDELSEAKGVITTSRLKMAITEALPVVRRYVSQLKSLQKTLVRMLIQQQKEATRKKER